MTAAEKPVLASPLPADIDARKAAMKAWYESLRDRICAAFEAIEDEIGDKAVFSGLTKIEPLAAAIEAMLADCAAYASYQTHFGGPPET